MPLPFEMTKEDVDIDEIFHGEPKPLHPDTIYEVSVIPCGMGHTPTVEQKSCEDQWNPVRPDPNWLDKLKVCVQWTAVFGGLCVLFCYWQQTGQMESSAAIPAMCACCTFAGLGVGKCVIGGKR